MAIQTRMLSQVWKAFKQLNPNNVAAEAMKQVRVGVVGTPDVLEETARFLLGSDLSAYDQASDVLALLQAPLQDDARALLPKCDVVLLYAGSEENTPGVPADRLFTFSSIPELPEVVKRIVREPKLAYALIPLARALPALRSEAAMDTIQTVSVENTIFVTSTSLGNIIPNPLQPLTSVAESVGDLVVLTANQLRMLFRLAGIYNREIGFRQQSPEVMSILAAAFGWRSIARELVSKIPLGGGVVAKAAIAFAGTWAIGDAIAFYYTTGRRLTKQELRERFDTAYEKGRSSAESITSQLRDTYARGRTRLMGTTPAPPEAQPEIAADTTKETIDESSAS